jgi:N6-L-threonylcarbamoyladenine synthase
LWPTVIQRKCKPPFSLTPSPLASAFVQRHNCDFSYAGLKTAVRLAVESEGGAAAADRQTLADIAASFQRVAVHHLSERCRRAVLWALDTRPEIR